MLGAHLHAESVIEITGKVRARPAGTNNDKIPTGQVEVLVKELRVQNHADPLPFQIDDPEAAAKVAEDTRLRRRVAVKVLHLALAPKSNSVVAALDRARQAVRDRPTGAVPTHLRDAHYPGASGLGHGRDYVYPHDLPGGVAAQQYLPDPLAGRQYYRPTRHGSEAGWADVLARLEALRSDGPANGDD